VPQDEVGLWTPTAKMVKLADTQYRNLAGMGGRAALTTNAWDPAEHSVAQREFESGATDVYRQFVQPPKSLSFTNKAERRRIFRIVYPDDVRREHGGHVDLDAIEAEAAKLMVHDEAQAARFFGNMIIAGAGVAVDPKVWDDLARAVAVPDGAQIGLGFDGSISDDATILRGCTREGHSFILGAWVRPRTEQELAQWLAEHPRERAWRVIRSEVNDAVREAHSRYQVGLMLCDPPRWQTEIEAWAASYGGEERVLAFDTNQARRMAPAVDRWRTALAEGTHTHDAHPPTSDHVKAAHLRKVNLGADEDDRRTRYVLVKGDDRRKIDGAIADVLAFEAAMTMPEPEPEPEPAVVLGRARRW
jgi:hypothetical protein